MESKIKKQKRICKHLITKLNYLDSNVSVLGGAPRDWFIDQEAADLDIYVNTKQDLIEEFNKLNIECSDLVKKGKKELNNTKPSEDLNDDYLSWYVDYILEFKIENEIIQLIVTNIPVDEVMSNFDLNISQFKYNGDDISYDKYAKIGMENKILIKLRQLGMDKKQLRYINKIKEKFNDFEYYESVDDYVNRNNLNWNDTIPF